MNTTMAPLDQIRRGSLGDLRRQHDSTLRPSMIARDEGEDQGSVNDTDDRGRERGDDNDREGDDYDDTKSSGDRVAGPAASTVFIVTTSAASPTFVSLAQPTSSFSLIQPSNKPISTLTAIPPPTLTPMSVLAMPSSYEQPRKGVNTDGYPIIESSTSWMIMTATTTIWSQVVIPQTVLGASPTNSAIADESDRPRYSGNRQNRDGQMSATAQHLLIAAGAIGAFIIITLGIYFITRLKKNGVFSSIQRPSFGSGGPRGWYGWRKQNPQYMAEYPPQYYAQDYASKEKSFPTQQNVEAFYTPGNAPTRATPSSMDALARADSQRQDLVRQALLENPAAFGTSQDPQTAQASSAQTFYGLSTQNDPLTRKPSTSYSNNGSQNLAVASHLADYNNTGSRNMVLTTQTTDQNNAVAKRDSRAVDPNQRDVKYMSYMSSLSSGFGDGLVMPQPTIAGEASRQTYRQSRNPGVSRFSWATSAPRTPGYKGDRDTMYTTASTDTPPRFRTVNSWVAQQAGRVDVEQQRPSMPPVPQALQNAGVHQRKASEDPAFSHHPGDEVRIRKGSRVPSEILDTKNFVN